MSKPADAPAPAFTEGVMPLLTRIGRLGYAWLEPRLQREGISLADFRLVGALLLEQNDEWAVQRARYMTLETIGQMSDDPLISLPAVAR